MAGRFCVSNPFKRMAVFLILLITLITISAQTFKTAQANPVDALKNE
jgi:hypothetical protein